MDEELEQRGVTPKSFFDQVTETRETAQTAQKTSNSNLTLLKELKEKVEIISNDLKFLKDEAKDRAFEEEDREQKEEMEAKVKEQNEKAQGATLGDKGGVKEPEQKGLMGQVGSFLSNLIGGLVGGAIGFTLAGIGGMIGGIVNLGKKALDLGKSLREKIFGKKKKDKDGGKVKTDKLLGVVEEEDKEKDSQYLNTVREDGKVIDGNATQEQSDLLKRQMEIEDEIDSLYETGEFPDYDKIAELEKESEEIDKKLFNLEKNLEKSPQPEKKKDKRGILGMIGGTIDAITGNLTDLDKRGGKTFGATRVATGMLDFFTADMFDLDKRGKMDLFGMRKKNGK